MYWHPSKYPLCCFQNSSQFTYYTVNLGSEYSIQIYLSSILDPSVLPPAPAPLPRFLILPPLHPQFDFCYARPTERVMPFSILMAARPSLQLNSPSYPFWTPCCQAIFLQTLKKNYENEFTVSYHLLHHYLMAFLEALGDARKVRSALKRQFQKI